MNEMSSLASREDLGALRESVAQVLDSICDNRAVHAFIDGRSQLDAALWSQAAELGWLAIALPEAYGGLGLGVQGVEVLHRELGRHVAPGPFIPTLVGAQWLLEFADEVQKAEYLPKLIAGELTVAVPAVMNSAPLLELRRGRVDGQLEVVGAGTAGIVIAPVGSHNVITGWAIIVCDGSSASLSPLDAWDLTRRICRLTCASAPATVIPDPDGAKGRALARHLGLALASDSLGAAAAITDQTLEYLKTRKQFDRPIGSFQALKHRAADLVTLLATNGHLIDQAVEAAALASPDSYMWAMLAKAAATEAGALIAGDCIQLFGGIGQTWEFDAHLYAKRARLNEALGTNNGSCRDLAAVALAAATRSGRLTTELGG
jgi:alkylation response protein AidB-like acyl-CoA dehydrogenase